VGDDPAGSAQQAWVAREAERLSATTHATRAPGIGTLPSLVERDSLPAADRLQAVFGIGQRDLVPVQFDLALGGVLIAGPNRSGKSTALLTVALALTVSTPEALLYCLAPRRSALSDADIWTGSASGVGACEELVAELSATIAERSATTPVILFIDDTTELDDSSAASTLEHLARRGRDLGVSMVVAAESSLARRSYSGPVPEIRRDRQGVLLMPDIDMDGDLLGVRVPRNLERARPGRGYAVTGGVADIVQVGA
jgi:S-DNA-T family DNA segregation ATPase FtsK/SpoIIIE